jgi:hypothetical protein
MPETTITINRGQRAGFYELIRNHLSCIEDFWVALERAEDFVTAERMGLELADDFRLLRDIGWSEHDVRAAYVLTMPTQELADLLKRLRVEAASALIETGAEAQSSRDEAETDRRLRDGFEGCGTVLADLAPLAGA